jgi:heat shock protein HtpX
LSLKQRALLAVALTAGFYVLALLVAGLLLLLPVLEGILLHQVTARLVLFCVVGAGIVLWSIVPRRSRFAAPGPRLLPAGQPRLFQVLEDVARRVGEPAPDEVHVVLDVNAGVLETGGWLGFGRRRVMLLGLPLLQVLTVSQLHAVLAHEFGHYRGGDTRLGPWIYRTREAIGRTLGALHGRSAALHVPFALYGRLFLRVTQAVSRRQEYAADELAALVIGARPLSGALRAIAGAGLAYPAFWEQELAPVLNAGYRPPLVAGFAEYLDQPHVFDRLDAAVDRRMAEPRHNPYDSHPPDADRIRFLAGLPPGPGISSDPPAISMLDGVPAIEADLIASLVRQGAPAPQPITWDEVCERVLVPSWERLHGRTAAGLDGATAGSLPALTADSERLGTHLARALGVQGDVAPERARSLAVDVLGVALALALRANGWMVQAPPGAPVTMRRQDACVEPFLDAARLIAGEQDAARWQERCQRLGIGDVPLHVVAAVEASTQQAREPATAPVPWMLVSNTCRTGWLNWGRGELLVSARGIVRRRLGVVTMVLQTLPMARAVDRSQPVWLSEVDAQETARAHRTNLFLPRDAIQAARLRRGIFSGRLLLELAGGGSARLYWLAAERADLRLHDTLRDWLGDRLELR